MHILTLSKYYYPDCGGVETVCKDICEGLNHDVTVISSQTGNHNPIEIINNIEVRRHKDVFRFASASFSISYIVDVIRKIDTTDLIHVHLPNPLANMALYVASFFKKKLPPIVVHWHSDIIKQKNY